MKVQLLYTLFLLPTVNLQAMKNTSEMMIIENNSLSKIPNWEYEKRFEIHIPDEVPHEEPNPYPGGDGGGSVTDRGGISTEGKTSWTPSNSQVDATVNKASNYFKQKLGQYVYDKVNQWALDNGYSEEATQLAQKAKKISDCFSNSLTTTVGNQVKNDSSCISCEELNVVSNIGSNSDLSLDEIKTVLKLLHSLEEISQCKFDFACLNESVSCSSSASTKEANNHYLSALLILLNLIVIN